MSFVSSPFSLLEEESIYISLSLPFIQDSLTAIAQLHVHIFGSCFFMFFPSTPIGSLHALFPFLTQRGHSISPSLFFILIPDNSQSLSPSRRISLLLSPSPPAPRIIFLCPEPVPLLHEERFPAIIPPMDNSLHTSCSL